jgi:hypothetical protein
MEDSTNLMTITALVTSDERIDYQRLKSDIEDRLLPFDRFRQRVVEPAIPLGTPHWEDDPNFDIEQHVHHVALPAPQDKAALMDFLSDVVSTPLDRSRPLWQVYVVDGVDGGGALAMRFHHCMGDGTAMMALAQEIYDLTPDAPILREQPETPRPEAGLLDKVFGPALSVESAATWRGGPTTQGGAGSSSVEPPRDPTGNRSGVALSGHQRRVRGRGAPGLRGGHLATPHTGNRCCCCDCPGCCCCGSRRGRCSSCYSNCRRAAPVDLPPRSGERRRELRAAAAWRSYLGSSPLLCPPALPAAHQPAELVHQPRGVLQLPQADAVQVVAEANVEPDLGQ